MKNEIAIFGQPLVAESIVQTCFACPSQWDGRLVDGRTFYARFRWGCLTVQVSPLPSDSVSEAVNGDYIFSGSVEDEWAGCMSTEEMLEIVKGVLIFSNSSCDCDDHLVMGVLTCPKCGK